MDELLQEDSPGLEGTGTAPRTEHRVGRALYEFLQTVLCYSEAKREVRTKREKLDHLEQELESQIKVLAKINGDFEALNADLRHCQTALTDAIAEKNILNEMLEQTQNRVVSIRPPGVCTGGELFLWFHPKIFN